MSLAPSQYTALKSELTTDPAAYGYATPFAAGDDVTLASILNQLFSDTLSGALTSGQAGVVALAVGALPFALPTGSKVTLLSGGNSQQVSVAAPGAAAGATSIPTASFTANAAYPVGTLVVREPVTVTSITTAQLQNAVVESEFVALTVGAQADWQDIILAGGGREDISLTGIRAQIGAIFGAGTQTRANLLQLQTRAGTRAEALFGTGANIQPSDIAIARVS